MNFNFPPVFYYSSHPTWGEGGWLTSKRPLKDLNGEEIKGTFYNEELSRYDSELYEIEKVLKRKKDKSLVKWKGYEKPSWIDSKSIIETK